MSQCNSQHVTLHIACLDQDGALTSLVDRARLLINIPPDEMAIFDDFRPFIDAVKIKAPEIVIASMNAPTPDKCIEDIVEAGRDAVIIIFKDRVSTTYRFAALEAGAHEVIERRTSAETLVDCINRHMRPARRARVLAPDSAPKAPRADQFAVGHIGGAYAAQTSALTLPTENPRNIRRYDIIEPLWAQERRIIETTLAAFDGNIARAAAALEINPSTIYRKRQYWASLGH